MPRSMTGYGSARAEGGGIAAWVEARSVNSRSLKIALKTPPSLLPHEADLEALARGAAARGSLTLFVRIEQTGPAGTLCLRAGIIEAASRALEALRKKGVVEGKLSADAAAQLPGALEAAADEPLPPAGWNAVRSAASKALAALDAMRRREGTRLARDLRRILGSMGKSLASVRKRAPAVPGEQRDRLRQRVEALLAGTGAALDAASLAREVALLADRSDVTEELARLESHLQEFGSKLVAEGEVGRSLEFLSQEILRESNTIGSKSADLAITRAVIALKSDADRLKEQAANFE
ncbi:MAG: YicC/YloC family endoribonuclease [Planctomycetaceae bacterium]